MNSVFMVNKLRFPCYSPFFYTNPININNPTNQPNTPHIFDVVHVRLNLASVIRQHGVAVGYFVVDEVIYFLHVHTLP